MHSQFNPPSGGTFKSRQQRNQKKNNLSVQLYEAAALNRQINVEQNMIQPVLDEILHQNLPTLFIGKVVTTSGALFTACLIQSWRFVVNLRLLRLKG